MDLYVLKHRRVGLISTEEGDKKKKAYESEVSWLVSWAKKQFSAFDC